MFIFLISTTEFPSLLLSKSFSFSRIQTLWLLVLPKANNSTSYLIVTKIMSLFQVANLPLVNNMQLLEFRPFHFCGCLGPEVLYSGFSVGGTMSVSIGNCCSLLALLLLSRSLGFDTSHG